MKKSKKRLNVFQRANRIRESAISLNYDWVLVAVVMVLCVSGLAFLASSMSTLPPLQYQKEFLKQLIFGVGLGSVCAVLLARLEYQTILKNSRYLLAINFLMLGFLAIFSIYTTFVTSGQTVAQINNFKLDFIEKFSFLPIRPHVANGAIRWIDFFSLIKFQPSELSKLVLLIYLASFFNLYPDQTDLFKLLKKPIYAFFLSAFFILVQPDLGTNILIFAILFAAMWSAGVNRKFLFGLVTVGIIFASIFTFSVGYRAERVKATFDSSSQNAGQIRGVQAAIQNGGIWGTGYGKSQFKQQSGVLFEESTDAIIAIIGEEMGFVFTIFFLSLYLVFLWRTVEIAKNAPDIGGRALAIGIAVWIVAQAFFNVSGIIGITPLKGIPMPFVSKGGSAILLNLIAFGILLNISKQGLDHKENLDKTLGKK
jgi:cell division protein FtsW